MSDLVAIVPSRGRPNAVVELAEALGDTCTANTGLLIAMDEGEPLADDYRVAAHSVSSVSLPVLVVEICGKPQSMVTALNGAAQWVLTGEAQAIAFLGDDHRPRTKGWDAAYLESLQAKPGLVYGNDLVQGERLPTQVAISACIVRALGHMAPPVLRHLYVDNYWLTLGRATGRITYLPDVIVEHLHPVAGTAEMDDGYRRVNAPDVYQHDGRAFADYWQQHAARDIGALRQAVAA